MLRNPESVKRTRPTGDRDVQGPRLFGIPLPPDVDVADLEWSCPEDSGYAGAFPGESEPMHEGTAPCTAVLLRLAKGALSVPPPELENWSVLKNPKKVVRGVLTQRVKRKKRR